MSGQWILAVGIGQKVGGQVALCLLTLQDIGNVNQRGRCDQREEENKIFKSADSFRKSMLLAIWGSKSWSRD